MSIKIILADDHTFLRAGLRVILENQFDLEVVAEAEDGREAVRLVREHRPDLVIMDISMPGMNGMEAARRIMEEDDSIRIIVLSVHSEKQFVSGMMRAGAAGYLLKDCIKDELITAIRTVSNGKRYISPAITGVLCDEYTRLLKEDEEHIFAQLTGREREVLQLIAEGKSTKQAAAELHISVKTVETHRQNIMNKLEIYNIPELVKYAIQQGVIDIL